MGRWFLRLTFVLLLATPGASKARAEQPRAPVKVVASFSVLADLVRNVGGERIELATLIGSGGDTHVYAPAPSDVRLIAAARLVFVNGLGFEGWLPRLRASAGNKATLIETSAGIAARRTQGEGRDALDPHAWQSVANAKTYVANIRDALTAADPAGAEEYRAAASAYLDKLDRLDREVRDMIATLPADRRKLVTTHDAFGYFGAAYGLSVITLQGVSTDTEPTAKAIAALVSEIKASKIPAIFQESASDPRLIQRIAVESGAKIGGTLYSDSLTDARGDAPTYIDMIRHNIRTLTSALGQ